MLLEGIVRFVATIYEITTDWQFANSSGGKTVMYFSGTPTVSLSRERLGDLWESLANQISSSTTWTVATTGKVLNDADGSLLDYWTDTTEYSQPGAAGGQSLANSTQILLKWFTNGIVGNRRVQGRSYVPGIGSGTLDNGDPSGPTVNAVRAAVKNYLTEDTGLVIWSRPSGGRAGSSHAVVDADTWDEYAVQRRRRD